MKQKRSIIIPISLFLALHSCKQISTDNFLNPSFPSVTADVETQPTKASSLEDAADDPAIFVHQTHPEKSLIIGTNKTAGLSVYNLEGKEIHFERAGRVNNVDLRDHFKLPNGDSITIVACSERQKKPFWSINWIQTKGNYPF